MGDHRADIKIEFQIYGSEVFKLETHCYYEPDETGVDPRISDFFVTCYEKAKDVYDEECFREENEGRTRQEQKEWEGIKRRYLELKTKFEPDLE